MTQNQALKIMLSGDNIFLTGPPGSGKTYLLNEYIARARKKKLKIAVTATTGIAATHLNGLTFHSWAGIGIKNELSEKEIRALISRADLTNRYKFTDVLVIDEVSMLDSKRLDLLNQLAKIFRASSQPMGGMQLILVGDLFQLPPVTNDQQSYIFKSKAWKELDLSICYLSEQHRQKTGDELNHILRSIRNNTTNRSELRVLESKINVVSLNKRNITRLYAHNFDADRLNDQKLAELKSSEKIYKMRTKGSKEACLILKKAILSPEILRLKVGCEVIFTANNYKAGYVNGDRGKVVDFISGWPVIRMSRKAYMRVGLHSWRTEVAGQLIAQAWQLPLKLAWAITIHKSQGMSLDHAEIDLRRAFKPGMGYVALSRLRSIDGLYLIGLNKMALYVDNNVLKIDKILRAESDKLMLR